jgi:cell division transport system permease protein
MALDSESRWRLVRMMRARGRSSQETLEPIIRLGTEADLPAMVEIYNYYIQNSVVTFDIEPMVYKDWASKFQWINKLGLPFIVAESPSGQIIGFAYVAPWRQKAAFKRTVEDSVYLRFISDNEAAETFIENTGEDFTKFLEDNPLRDSYVFSVSEEFQSSEQLTLIAKELETQPGVFEVSYMTDLVDSINKNLFKVSLIMGGFILILIVTVIMLINNTIRLALFSQRFLIRSMQLVGATRGFIRKPFLIRAFLFGILAGILASAILFALLEYTKGNIEGFASLQNTELMLLLFAGLIISGGCLSGISTLRSVNKYLNMSLDELY